MRLKRALVYVAAAAPLMASALFADSLAIEGGTIHPIAGEPYVGTVVIEDGVIAAAGAAVVAPAGAARIDASGLHVWPGLMDALSQVGLVEINAVPATVDQAEAGAYNPHLVATTAVHPASEVIPVTRANGITHVLVAPEAEGQTVIPGRAAIIHLAGWTVEEMAAGPSTALVVAWPGIVTRRFDFLTFSLVESPFNEAKEAAEKAQNELRDWFDAARHYARATAGERVRTERDLKLEALARSIEEGRKVVVIAQSSRDIEDAVAFAEEQGIDIVLAGGREAWKVKELLAEKSIPVILGMTQSLPREEDDPYDLPYRAPGELAAAGVKIAFGSGAGGGFGPGGPHASRSIPWEAATAVPYGLSAEDALKALTLWPAEMLGAGERLGSIEPGKIANLLVTEGSPLEITFRLRHLVIGGREVSTANRHRNLYETYRAR